MQIANEVAKRGIVIGWDPLKLGNALSCVASLFLFSRRTGVASVYPYADRYSGVFQSAKPLSEVYITRSVDREQLEGLEETLSDTLETLPHLSKIAGTSFEDLGKARVNGVVWFSRREGSLQDWQHGDAERNVRAFCRRGNALVQQGSYWRQYLDMRPLAKAGNALRAYLGPVRTSPEIESMQHLAGVLKIGLHLRLGDYKVWLDGRFYFELEDYRSVADRIHAELGDRPHVFFVVSDQPIPAEFFDGLPVIISNGDLFEDFARLNRCNLVVGPPSTFSTWAAFCGQGDRVVLTKERIAASASIRDLAIAIPFPSGSYLPGDPSGAPI